MLSVITDYFSFFGISCKRDHTGYTLVSVPNNVSEELQAKYKEERAKAAAAKK